jgi:hypothetical protein
MPLLGTNTQLDTSRYFASYFIGITNPLFTRIPEDINELDVLIDEMKNTLDFINSVYEEGFNTKKKLNDPYDEYILETIALYENVNTERVMYRKSEYYVFDLGGYFISTKDKNIRNWIYSLEIEDAYNTLKEKIQNLELILENKIG